MATMKTEGSKKYWLVKSEPTTYSIADLKRDGATRWDGVRNYQARNFLKEWAVGDEVLMYHSNCEPPGIAGVARVSAVAIPDPTQFDQRSKYFDKSATKEKPRWFAPEITFVKEFSALIPLETLRENRELADMLILRKGSRLSVVPLTAEEFKCILAL